MILDDANTGNNSNHTNNNKEAKAKNDVVDDIIAFVPVLCLLLVVFDSCVYFFGWFFVYRLRRPKPKRMSSILDVFAH